MCEEKGLDASVADKIGEYVKLKGGEDLLQKLSEDAALNGNKLAKEGITEMKLLFQYLKAYGILDRVRIMCSSMLYLQADLLLPMQMSFDLSLARGLDYYTGIIYEAVTAESAPPGKTPSALPPQTASSSTPAVSPPPGTVSTNGAAAEDEDAKVGVGSVAAGGRYDNLVGMFSPSGTQVPCVGISFGVERLFSILWRRQLAEKGRENVKSKEVDVFVMAVGDALLVERMQIAKELWDGGIRVSNLAF